MDVKLVAGIPLQYRDAAVEVFWEGFGGKMRRLLGDDERARQFWRAALTNEGNTLAIDGDTDEVLGLLATSDVQHKATSHQWRAAVDAYGPVRALAVVPLALLDHKVKPKELYIEYLAVAPQARGRGVGAALLAFAEQLARMRGRDRLTLEVIDTNPRAKALYERSGFTVYGTHRMVPGSQWLFGFKTYDAMVRPIDV